jgi:2-iminoacetate synthase ThiH
MGMDKLEYNLQYESIVNQNMVIVANRDTGKWIKISKQCFDIINLAIENKWNRKELIKNLADDEDRKYIEQLLNKLIELRAITENGVDLLKIETVYLILTNRCNLQCKHCCVSAESVKGIALQNEMDTILL